MTCFDDDGLNKKLKSYQIALLNISLSRNKFQMLKEVIGNKIDNLLIPEIKLDETFPLNHFVLEGFTPSCWRPNAFR